MGKISRDCDKDVTSGKSWSSRCFLRDLWAKAGPNRASIDTSEKRIMLDYQLTVLLVKVVLRLSLKISRQYETYTWLHVAPPSVVPIHWHKIGSIPFVALCSLYVPKII